jgi:hypothetical protein
VERDWNLERCKRAYTISIDILSPITTAVCSTISVYARSFCSDHVPNCSHVGVDDFFLCLLESVVISMDDNNCLISEKYFKLFFDVNRGGFLDVAERILVHLDYASFVQFKRTCHTVYDFIKSSNLERVNCFFL